MDNFNDMSDEEFRKEFVRIINMYQSGMSGFIRQMYGNEPTRRNNKVSDDEIFSKFFNNLPNDMGTDSGVNKDGNGFDSWNWSPSDGSNNFRSYEKSFFDGMVNDGHTPKINTLELLRGKLNSAVMEERFEDAGDIHNLMEKLKESDETKNTKE